MVLGVLAGGPAADWRQGPAGERKDTCAGSDYGADCTAVGSYSNGGNSVTLAERWDGTSWTVQPTPSPGQNDNLTSVSCTSDIACTAAGYENNAGTQVTLAERWDGTSWTVEPTPSLSPNPYNTLFGVSCTSPAACTAVGQH